jgi:hypothetical protein
MSDEQLKDERGVVWSADHHDESKEMTTRGKWKAKKGGDKKAREAYESLFLSPASPPTQDEDAQATAEPTPPAPPVQEDIPSTPPTPPTPPAPPVESGYKNTSGGKLEIWGVHWEVDEAHNKASKDIENSKKFKNAVRMKLLTKV